MTIDNQNAENIYNVLGDMNLQNSPEIVELLKKEKQERLKELNSISFIDILSKQYSEKQLVERVNEIKKINKLLVTTRELMIYGEPGLGKTTTLFQLSKVFDNVIYISLKGRAPISSLLYVINKIRLASGDELIDVQELNEAYNWLQNSLQKTKSCFIIDDCEQDIGTVIKLISFEKFETTFLYSTRNFNFFASTGVKLFQCSPFEEEEVKQFLKSYNISLGVVEFNKIFAASGGNPLYLFYFAHFQITPLPTSLIEYQNSIWSGLSPRHKEILSVISIPYFSITINELSEVLNLPSILECSLEIDNLSYLVKNSEGVLEIFHHSFKEFVIEYLNDKGLLKHYLTRLGEYYLSKERIIQATYLLIDILPDRVDKYLMDVFPNLIRWGELTFALKVINTKLKSATCNDEKGYLNYHLSSVHNLLGNKQEANHCIDKSINFLRGTEQRKIYLSALLFKAMDLIDLGEVNQAKEIADSVFSSLSEGEKEVKALLLINLSKIYVDLSEFEQGARACKEAFELFEKQGFVEGMINSLVNMVSCLAQINGYIEDAEKYGLRLLEILNQTKDFSVEIVVLNALTSIYRQKKGYNKAKEFCIRAIKLCQKFEMKDKVVINLINYGNIYRDEGDLEKAQAIYDEALIYSKEYKLKKEEGRIYWIQSSMNREAGRLEASLEFADKSIFLNKEMNFYYGIAHALKEKSRTLLLLDKSLEAAEVLIECADYFGKTEEYSNLYQYNISKAISIYSKKNEFIIVNELLKKLILSRIKNIDYGKILQLILENVTAEYIDSNLELLFVDYITNEKHNQNILREFILFINYCKDRGAAEGKVFFRKIISLIIENLGKIHFSCSILAIAIEQSGWLIDENDLNEIFGQLKEKLTLFSVREIGDEKIIVTSIQNKINLEIHTVIEELICNKLAISLILFLLELQDNLIDEAPFVEIKCVLWLNRYNEELSILLKSQIPSKEDLFSKDSQSLHMGKNDYDAPEFIIINKDYEKYSDLILYPDNKPSLYFFVSTITGIMSHFTHIKIQEDGIKRRYYLNTVARLFDYINQEIENNSNKLKFEINIDKITKE